MRFTHAHLVHRQDEVIALIVEAGQAVAHRAA
jgi:hypothetical protein